MTEGTENTGKSAPVHAFVLLPCPFCGGTAVISESDDGLPRWLFCEVCECDGPPIDHQFKGSRDEALQYIVSRWNYRVSQEFICTRCYLRQDATPKTPPSF